MLWEAYCGSATNFGQRCQWSDLHTYCFEPSAKGMLHNMGSLSGAWGMFVCVLHVHKHSRNFQRSSYTVISLCQWYWQQVSGSCISGLFLLSSQTPRKHCSQWNSKQQCQKILSLRPSGTQTVRIPLGQKFAPAWAEPRGFLPKGSESWRLRGSLCSLISLPQDTWRRHMLMRTNSPAARVIRGREFYLNFGACSNIQRKALFAHTFGLHHHHLGLNMRLSGSCKVSWLPSLFTAILCWVYFHECVF